MVYLYHKAFLFKFAGGTSNKTHEWRWDLDGSHANSTQGPEEGTSKEKKMWKIEIKRKIQGLKIHLCR